ncbi:MAG: TonB-dependent receptor [Chromatiales bacterium]|jgi:outer membrane receptor protein involved in Fe transport|nr:TonB-dependent receptor [Chromatiales bacterium]
MGKRKVSSACLLGLFAGAAWGDALEVMTVTATREEESLAQTPASVGVIDQEQIRFAAPSHPQQILGKIPGVAIGVTNGEGHNTAIRQPFTTNPVYLFLEDGLPIRATGFFNHNALYEINIPAAGGIEVVRGPGSALYGSDAIGGIVNVLTATPATEPGASVSGEAGSFGWYRMMASGDSGLLRYGSMNANLNLSHSDGWRAATDYDRRSAGMRWDYEPSASSTLRTVLSFTDIDQQTGANSPLMREDYLNNPTKNNFSIAYRSVQALRLSSNYERELGDNTLLSVTPYMRHNSMELNASFLLSSDPTISRTEVWSYGFLAKWRKDFPDAMQARLIAGLDVDYSPGTHDEDNLIVTTTGTGANRNYESYTHGTHIYDYEARYQSASPYLHTEISPTERLRLTAGLRYDVIRYDMSNQLAPGAVAATVNGATRYYYQIEEASVDFEHLSPKFGLTYALRPSVHLYASHNHGFRVPSESQLFRAGNDATQSGAQTRADNALSLKPIKADQTELGVRGVVASWQYDAVAYLLRKRDDLVTQRDLATDVTVNLNAGKTEHKGIEVGLGRDFAERWRFDAALSYAEHRYVDWVTSTADFSGKAMESAPRWLTNTRLTWEPLPGTRAQFEWVHVGSYWLEASNNPSFGKYEGHDLYNLRLTQQINDALSLFARVMNITDERYADSASVSSNTPVFSPGLPRSWYAGAQLDW